MWVGVAGVAGDATAGFTRVTFVPQNPATTPTLDDHRRVYMWMLDGVSINDGAVDPLSCSVEIFNHWASPGGFAAAGVWYQKTVDMSETGGQFKPLTSLVDPEVARMPIFWDNAAIPFTPAEIVRLTLQRNTDNNEATFIAWGRYYDRQVLANRAFGRLVQPAAISQFA